jgi:hypothetical protein
MPHVRQSIRENVETTLTGLTTTGSRVYASRVFPLAADKLPGLAIYSSDESTEYVTTGLPRTQLRTLSINVEAYVRGNSNYDDSLDTICSEIEAALYTDGTRGGYAKDTKITAMDSEFSGDGDQPVARATLRVEVEYATKENDVTTAV